MLKTIESSLSSEKISSFLNAQSNSKATGEFHDLYEQAVHEVDKEHEMFQGKAEVAKSTDNNTTEVTVHEETTNETLTIVMEEKTNESDVKGFEQNNNKKSESNVESKNMLNNDVQAKNKKIINKGEGLKESLVVDLAQFSKADATKIMQSFDDFKNNHINIKEFKVKIAQIMDKQSHTKKAAKQLASNKTTIKIIASSELIASVKGKEKIDKNKITLSAIHKNLQNQEMQEVSNKVAKAGTKVEHTDNAFSNQLSTPQQTKVTHNKKEQIEPKKVQATLTQESKEAALMPKLSNETVDIAAVKKTPTELQTEFANNKSQAFDHLASQTN